MEEEYKSSIVPPNTPQSIRVDSILKEIVEAMHSSLRLLQNSGKWKRTRFTAEHLDGMQWKVMLVDSKDRDGAFYLTNGTIVVFTSLLGRLQSDAEVATVLGHEVGHGLARHSLEEVSRCLRTFTFLPMLMFIPHFEVPLTLVFSFYSRRKEMEADYIRMMLMASAGYDPRLAPTLYESRLNPVKMILRGTGNELLVHNNKAMERSTQKRVRKFGWRFATKHLDGLNWEVMVVNSYTPNAFYLPNGKIVIFTGLFNKLKSDGVVAAVLGHEVRHGIARHVTEHFFRCLGLCIWLILISTPNPEINAFKFLLSFISRRREMEVDYIGMMLMASAGYDPRVAPRVFLKIDGSDHHHILSTHPCGRKRAEKLENAKVMEQAMAIYRDVTSGLEVRCFI